VGGHFGKGGHFLALTLGDDSATGLQSDERQDERNGEYGLSYFWRWHDSMGNVFVMFD
jgi:hypothetical protein